MNGNVTILKQISTKNRQVKITAATPQKTFYVPLGND